MHPKRIKHILVLSVAISAYLYLFFQSQFFLAVNHANLQFVQATTEDPIETDDTFLSATTTATTGDTTTATTTALLRETTKKLKFLQISDLHASTVSFTPKDRSGLSTLAHEIFDLIRSEKPDYIFITGDFVDYGYEENARNVARNFLRNMSLLMDEIHGSSTSDSLSTVDKNGGNNVGAENIDENKRSGSRTMKQQQKKQRLFGVIGNHDHRHEDTNVREPSLSKLQSGYPHSEVERKNRVKALIETEGHVKILENDFVYVPEDDLLIIGLGDPFTFEHVSFRPELVRESLKKQDFSRRRTGESNGNSGGENDGYPFSVVLSHNPDTAACLIHNADSYHFDISESIEQMPILKKRIQFLNEVEKKHLCDGIPADLILSGHTHGGQLSTPGGGSLLRIIYDAICSVLPLSWTQKFEHFAYVTVRHWNWLRGIHEYRDRDGRKQYLYINSGIHTSKYLRLWTPPEATIFNVEY